jgi:integrase
MLSLAVECGIIAKSPLDAIKPLKMAKPIRLQPSWTEALKIIEHVELSAPDSSELLRFMLLFGVGQAEVQGLHGEHFDFDRKELQLFRQKTQKEYTVPIYDHANAFVQGLKEKGMIVNGKPVFTWHNPRKALESACQALHLPKYSPRSLRRSFVVRCLEKGMEARVVADYQGHADATLILRVYGKFISPEHAKLQVAKLLD